MGIEGTTGTDLSTVSNHAKDEDGLSGRASRREWLFLQLWAIGLLVAAGFLVAMGSFFTLIGLFFILAAVWNVFSSGVRRLHDMGKSGFFFLFTFVPIANLILLLALAFVPGKDRKRSETSSGAGVRTGES